MIWHSSFLYFRMLKFPYFYDLSMRLKAITTQMAQVLGSGGVPQDQMCIKSYGSFFTLQ